MLSVNKINPKTFNLIFWVGLILTSLFFSINAKSSYSPDEHFQIIEFANWKLGKVSENTLPWEFAARLRPTLQPTIMYFLYRGAENFFGFIDHFQFAIFLRILSNLLFLVTVFFLLKATRPLIDKDKFIYYQLMLGFFWYVIPNHVRFTSENWASNFFALAFCLMISPIKRKNYLWLGVLLGLAFWFRFQVGLMIAGYYLWMVLFNRQQKDFYYKMFFLSLGLGVILIAGVLLDSWFYQEWALSPLNYFRFNIVEDGASTFGTSPFWYYFLVFLQYSIPPFSIVFFVLVISFFIWNPRSILLWTAGLFFLIHSFIGHKEVRFLIPIILLLPLTIFLAWQNWQAKVASLQIPVWIKGWLKLFSIKLLALVNVLFLVGAFLGSYDLPTTVMEKLYKLNLEEKKAITVFTYSNHPDNFIRPPFHHPGMMWFYTPPQTELVNFRAENFNEKINDTFNKDSLSSPSRSYFIYTEEPLKSEEINFFNQHSFAPKLVFEFPPPFLKERNYFNWIEKTKMDHRFLYRILPK